jgi:hypothetical protein
VPIVPHEQAWTLVINPINSVSCEATFALSEFVSGGGNDCEDEMLFNTFISSLSIEWSSSSSLANGVSPPPKFTRIKLSNDSMHDDLRELVEMKKLLFVVLLNMKKLLPVVVEVDHSQWQSSDGEMVVLAHFGGSKS